jgi:uncharacterized protein YkwD
MKNILCIIILGFLFYKAPYPVMASLQSDINTYRQAHGLRAVSSDGATCQYARQRVMQAAQEFSHRAFYLSASKMRKGTLVVENLGVQYDPSYNVFAAWTHSPSHNANLLKSYDHLCVQAYRNTNGHVYYAMIGMASPR